MTTAPGPRDSFCHRCGAAYPDASRYPRRCAACGNEVWANPIPVSVALVPVIDGARTGLLVVRRAIQPQLGKLALVGGFLEEHESWAEGAARETREETGVVIDPAGLRQLTFVSSRPRPSRVLLFSVARPIEASALGAFTPSPETSERGLVFGPRGLEELFAFDLHVEAARQWFASVGLDGAHEHRPA